MEISSASVGVCRGGCAGAWFGPAIVERITVAKAGEGASFLSESRTAAADAKRGERRLCPECDETVMVGQFYAPDLRFRADACPVCDGFWLDAGELREIASASGDDRTTRAKALFSVVFGTHLAEMHKRSANKAEKAEKIARLIRFVTPADLQPPRQEWEPAS